MGANKDVQSKYSADGSFYIFTETGLVSVTYLLFI